MLNKNIYRKVLHHTLVRGRVYANILIVGKDKDLSQDNAWSYPEPKQSGIDMIHKDFSNYVAFWRDVKVTE